jgi:uncharacterized protein YjbI with pentapeptide repeats
MTWFLSKKPLPKFQIKNLSGEVIFERPWTDLHSRNLSAVVLHNADPRNVRMDYCDCRGTDFTGSKFGGALLIGCDLRGALLNYCELSDADLSSSQIAGAEFYGTEFGKPKHRCRMQDVKAWNRLSFLRLS